MRKKKEEVAFLYKIAFLDDEQGIIDSLSTVIKKIGYASKGFTNPLEAIEEIKNDHFDMLILDYLMKPMNGDEVIARIREFNKDIYILLLTGHKDIAPPLETIRGLDIQGYCEKSDKFDQLILLVESGIKAIKQTRMIYELQQANKQAEEAISAQNEFFANVSHELRTPVSVMFSAIQLLDFYMASDIIKRDAVRHHLMSMKQNCLRLTRLVNNILDTTKIDVSHYDLNMQNWDIVMVVQKIIASIEAYTDQKDIKLEFHTDIPKKILTCDINVVERAILNLLSNAIKFVGTSGKITVSLNCKEDAVEISVKDNGIGIPKEMQMAIFERFKQVDNLLTRKHEGSGIGLSLTKTLIEIHGGKVTLESQIGEGSIFTISLPDRLVEQKGGDIGHSNFNQSLIEKIHIEFSDIYNIS